MGFLDTLFKNVQNAFGGIGNAVSGAMKTGGQAIGGAVNAGQKVGQSFGKSALGQFAPQAIKGMMGNAGRMGPQVATPPMKGFASMSNRMGPMMSPGQTNPIGGGFSDSGDSSKKSGFNLMDLFGGGGKVIGGLGVTGLGQMLGGNTKMPSFQTDAMKNYQNYNTGSLPPGVEDMINRTAQINEDQATKQLRDVYKNARPGTDYTTDSAYQRDLANLQRTQTLNRADAQAQALMGFNEQELSRASELAQLSIAEIMARTGMEAQEAQSIKEMFGNVGGMMISSGLGLDKYGFGDE